MGASLDREVKRILKEAGCSFFRHGNGSHEIWQNPCGNRFTVSYDIRNLRTVNSILKEAGIEVSAREALAKKDSKKRPLVCHCANGSSSALLQASL